MALLGAENAYSSFSSKCGKTNRLHMWLPRWVHSNNNVSGNYHSRPVSPLCCIICYAVHLRVHASISLCDIIFAGGFFGSLFAMLLKRSSGIKPIRAYMRFIFVDAYLVGTQERTYRTPHQRVGCGVPSTMPLGCRMQGMVNRTTGLMNTHSGCGRKMCLSRGCICCAIIMKYAHMKIW